MHYQTAPYEEAKLVQCTAGAIYDVIIDLRIDSPTFQRWFSHMLTADNYKMLYVPRGFAHGFLSLKDNTTVFYQMSGYYHPECGRTIRWDNPQYNIVWPKMNNYIISEKDRQGE
jgi:dTDP-4-dehydrorhamnose 3,5-epimerase